MCDHSSNHLQKIFFLRSIDITTTRSEAHQYRVCHASSTNDVFLLDLTRHFVYLTASWRGEIATTVLESCIPKHENTSTRMISPGKKGENLSRRGMQPQTCTCVPLSLPHRIVTGSHGLSRVHRGHRRVPESCPTMVEGPRLWPCLGLQQRRYGCCPWKLCYFKLCEFCYVSRFLPA
jgi:hypothetical protein